MSEYFMTVRKETTGKSLQAFDGWVDWQVINAQYNQFYNDLLKCTSRGAHLVLTAEVDRLGDDESREVRAMFGRIGLKPREGRNGCRISRIRRCGCGRHLTSGRWRQ